MFIFGFSVFRGGFAFAVNVRLSSDLIVLVRDYWMFFSVLSSIVVSLFILFVKIVVLAKEYCIDFSVLSLLLYPCQEYCMIHHLCQGFVHHNTVTLSVSASSIRLCQRIKNYYNSYVMGNKCKYQVYSFFIYIYRQVSMYICMYICVFSLLKISKTILCPLFRI